jgi:hypothetical protein
MPTVGWIQESAWDRLLEARAGPAHVFVPRIEFRCSWCQQAFATYEDLCIHTSRKHPLELPTLHLRGEPVLRDHVVRTRLETPDVQLVQCTLCELQVDGGEWRSIEPDEFRRRFSSCSDALWNVRLINDQTGRGAGVSDTYRIRFSIPNSEELDTIDDLFCRMLAIDEPEHGDLAAFDAALPSGSSAREYGTALGDYALGVLLKEKRSGLRSSPELKEAIARMRVAFETLRLFDRPVAQVVSGVVRFNLNDFRNARPTASAELDAGFRFFQQITGTEAADEHPGTGDVGLLVGSRSAICPIDTVSFHLLTVCERATTGGIRGADLVGLEQAYASESLNEYDASKLHALCAYGFLKLGQPMNARPHLRAIRFNSWMQSWVQCQLEEHMPDEN